jgi:hypothetical protein
LLTFPFHCSVWRHWGCVTPKIVSNLKKKFPEASELDGFDEIRSEDQDKVTKAYEDGHVAEEDVPESAKKKEGDEDAKPKKRSGGKKTTKVARYLFFLF